MVLLEGPLAMEQSAVVALVAGVAEVVGMEAEGTVAEVMEVVGLEGLAAGLREVAAVADKEHRAKVEVHLGDAMVAEVMGVGMKGMGVGILVVGSQEADSKARALRVGVGMVVVALVVEEMVAGALGWVKMGVGALVVAAQVAHSAAVAACVARSQEAVERVVGKTG